MKRLRLPSAMLGLTVLLTACPGAPTPSGSQGGVVEGTLTPYSLGAADIFAYAPMTEEVVAATTVAANGQFSLPLPTPGAGQLVALTGSGCAAQPQVSPADARFLYTDFYPVVQNNEVVGYGEEIVDAGAADGSGRSDLLRFYASAASKVTGQFVCGGATTTFDLDLKAGWNTVQRTIDTVSGGQVTAGTFQMYTGSAATLAFTPIPSSPAPSPQMSVFLMPNYTTVTRGESLTVEAQVYTTDETVGEVNVELINPPAGFTLATDKLSAASLSAASVQKRGAEGLLRRDRSLGGAVGALSSASLLPQGTRTGKFTINTTAEAQRTDTGSSSPHELRLRFTSGQQTMEATLYVNVTVPGVQVDLRDGFYTARQLVLSAGDTQTLTAFLTPQYGLTGEVRLSMEDAASGISGVGGPVTLGAETTSVPFTVTVPRGTAPGTYSLPVMAIHRAGTEQVATLSVEVKAATVSVNAQAVTLYGGETVSLPVTLKSEYGFEGAVTIDATGLPAGVTAAPVTVTVPRGGTVSASLPLTGAESVGVVSSTQVTVTVSGTNLSASGTAGVTLQPRRVLLSDMAVQKMVPAHEGGFWFISRPYGQYGKGVKLARFDGANVVDAVTIPSSPTDSWDLTTAPGGEVWGMTGNGTAVFRYAKGQLQTWETSVGHPSSSIAADNQQRLWFFALDESSGKYRFKRLDATTGQVETLDIYNFSWFYPSTFLVRNEDGSALFVPDRFAPDQKTARLVRVDTAIADVTLLPLRNLADVRAAAVDPAGTPWVYGSAWGDSPQAARVNGDGTLTPYLFESGIVPELFGFDGRGLLWGMGSSGGSVRALDPRTGAVVHNIEASHDSQRVAVNLSGGLWKTWADDTARGTYASLIR
ncbi:hypothetical protein V3W47_06210 [Deinococcus sp. YIM 134068]|uniref:hypothetical protein n=1 Tax=Deinococcus lichenicola TaxID=3118910 RepID=UPI002F94C6E3